MSRGQSDDVNIKLREKTGQRKKPLKGDWTDFWRKNPLQVTSHDGDL